MLDPEHDETDREFPLILFMQNRVLDKEEVERLKTTTQKLWTMSPPKLNGTVEEKKAWLAELKEVQEYIVSNKDKSSFKKNDVPNIPNLQDYLNSKKGEVIEVTLPDRRKLGIYPDNQKLKRIYDIEYHASTVVNIAKLFQLFDASEIVIKEL